MSAVEVWQVRSKKKTRNSKSPGSLGSYHLAYILVLKKNLVKHFFASSCSACWRWYCALRSPAGPVNQIFHLYSSSVIANDSKCVILISPPPPFCSSAQDLTSLNSLEGCAKQRQWVDWVLRLGNHCPQVDVRPPSVLIFLSPHHHQFVLQLKKKKVYIHFCFSRLT